MTGTWMARSEDDRSVSGLPRIGTRVRVIVGEGGADLVGSIVGYSVVHRGDAAGWRDGLGHMLALVALDGSPRYLEGVRVTTSILPCDLSAIELEEETS